MSRLITLTAALALVAATVVVAGCGEEEHHEVIEGEAIEVGHARYTVQLTRFMNPSLPEDDAYLAGHADAPEGKRFLGVFVKVENDGDEPVSPLDGLFVEDTRENHYEPRQPTNRFMLGNDEFGNDELAPGETAPRPGTPAEFSPISGSLVLFLVDDFVTENRPLTLVIPGPGDERGEVQLDM